MEVIPFSGVVVSHYDSWISEGCDAPILNMSSLHGSSGECMVQAIHPQTDPQIFSQMVWLGPAVPFLREGYPYSNLSTGGPSWALRQSSRDMKVSKTPTADRAPTPTPSPRQPMVVGFKWGDRLEGEGWKGLPFFLSFFLSFFWVGGEEKQGHMWINGTFGGGWLLGLQGLQVFVHKEGYPHALLKGLSAGGGSHG